MGLFGPNSPFDADVEKATSEKNTTEQWDLIMEICDKVGTNPKNAKECLRAILRRLANDDPHVALQAIVLLDACINNCGKSFQLEIASREFETEYRRLLQKSGPIVSMKMKVSLKKWAETEFKSDPQLILIPSLYQKLRQEGQDFHDNTTATPKQQPVLSKDPNVVSSQQEEDDIAKAIELSLKITKSSSPKMSTSKTYTTATSSSLYPAMALSGGGGGSAGATATVGGSARQTAAEPRKVRALYDFEAAEDNELTFLAGEIIHVLDDSDPNWWKGFNSRGEGLFPANFVSADLSAEPESMRNESAKKSVQFSDEQPKKEAEIETIEINEEKIDRLLHLLHEANPEDPSLDSYEMLQLEAQVNQMLPLIDTELERVDRKHAQLTQLSKDLVEANNFYHSLMREPERPMSSNYIPFPNTQSIYSQPGMHPTNGMFPMPNLFNMSQNMVPTSLPNMHPMPIIGGHQHQHMQMMQGYPMGPQFPSHQMIPQHMQNGHQQPTSSSGNMMMPPNSMMPSMQQQQHQPQSIPSLPTVPPNSASAQQQSNMQMGPTASMGQHTMIQQQQQQPVQLQLQNPQSTTIQSSPLNAITTVPTNHAGGNMFPSMPPQQHQQASLPPQQPHSINNNFPNMSIGSVGAALAPPHQQQQQPLAHIPMNMPPHSHVNQFNPQQQHMLNSSAMQSMINMLPAAMTQPVTTNILPSQIDTKQHIPAYHQQR